MNAGNHLLATITTRNDLLIDWTTVRPNVRASSGTNNIIEKILESFVTRTMIYRRKIGPTAFRSLIFIICMTIRTAGPSDTFNGNEGDRFVGAGGHI